MKTEHATIKESAPLCPEGAELGDGGERVVIIDSNTVTDEGEHHALGTTYPHVLPGKNRNAVQGELCRQIRRDLVLQQGAGIGALLANESQEPEFIDHNGVPLVADPFR